MSAGSESSRLRFLLDEMLSRSLCPLLSALGDVAHVSTLQLNGATDHLVWTAAAKEGRAIITKDDDFRVRAARHGHPPKVIQLRTGNQTTQQTLDTILANRDRIATFMGDDEASLLEVVSGPAMS